METVKLNDGEGRRVRFTGSFDRPAGRDSAVIRINGTEGSYEGKVYLTGLKFDDDKIPDLSSLTEEDLSTGHGGALRSVGTAALNGESSIVCDTVFTGNSDTDKVSIVLPLKGMDSSEFKTVYYDLYFEGTDSGLNFITGCDFAGREESDPALDKINEAFAVFRSKAAAGQDTKEAESNVLSAIEDMRKEISRFPETDPLVIRIGEALDKKEALVTGADSETGEASVQNAGDTKEGEEKAEGKDEKDDKAPVTPVPAGAGTSDEETGNGGAVAAIVICALFSLAMIALLFITELSGRRKIRESESVRKEKADSDRVRDEENIELRQDLAAVEKSSESLRKRIADTEASAAQDTSVLKNCIERIEEKIASAENSLSALEGTEGVSGPGRPEGAAMKDASKELTNLDKSGAALGSSIEDIREQLDETSESVKDINKAATIIADVASETNLLSLNASIEAARAGEAGRGFAVVAGEISRLAEQTERSVQEISDTVDKLNSDFEKTHTLMQGLEGYAAGQKESLQAARTKFTEAEEQLKNGSGSSGDGAALLKECRAELKELRILSGELRRELESMEAAGAADSRSELLAEISAELQHFGRPGRKNKK
ncbi:MAG: methyl-accepting chemotaxis protein [Lachnospiraceae bacterium]|nr:methyl-accepting chemotaxis protein [Lachnospiraceae bacterium]